MNKRCLCAYDDKRVLLEDGITTLAFGHYSIDAIEIEEPPDPNPQTVMAYAEMHPVEAARQRLRAEYQTRMLANEEPTSFFDENDTEDNCSIIGEEEIKEEIKDEPEIDIGF